MCLQINKFDHRHEEKVTDRAVNKLKALREALAHIKASTEHISQELSNETSSNIREKLVEMLTQLKERRESYRAEMRKVSLARDQGHWDDKASISMVLEAWKELKSIREHQGNAKCVQMLSCDRSPRDYSLNNNNSQCIVYRFYKYYAQTQHYRATK